MKPLSSCVLYGVGDIISQCIEGTSKEEYDSWCVVKSGFLFLRFLRMAVQIVNMNKELDLGYHIWFDCYCMVQCAWFNTYWE